MNLEYYTANWPSESDFLGVFEQISRQLDRLGGSLSRPRTMKALIASTFLEAGWAQDFKIPGSNLSVSFVKGETAACIQFGNVARVYADILKLQNLYDRELASNAVLVVPDDELSRYFGVNHASFSRTVRDLEALALSLTCPLLIISFGMNN